MTYTHCTILLSNSLSRVCHGSSEALLHADMTTSADLSATSLLSHHLKLLDCIQVWRINQFCLVAVVKSHLSDCSFSVSNKQPDNQVFSPSRDPETPNSHPTVRLTHSNSNQSSGPESAGFNAMLCAATVSLADWTAASIRSCTGVPVCGGTSYIKFYNDYNDFRCR